RLRPCRSRPPRTRNSRRRRLQSRFSAARSPARRRSRIGRGRTTNRARSVGRPSFCLLGAARGPPGVGASGWSLPVYRAFCHLRSRQFGSRSCDDGVNRGCRRQIFCAGDMGDFGGTSAYVATDVLKVAVNAAITLERPLLVKSEPGTGKTVL